MLRRQREILNCLVRVRPSSKAGMNAITGASTNSGIRSSWQSSRAEPLRWYPHETLKSPESIARNLHRTAGRGHTGSLAPQDRVRDEERKFPALQGQEKRGGQSQPDAADSLWERLPVAYRREYAPALRSRESRQETP